MKTTSKRTTNKGKKKLYDCYWYRYEYDDFDKYHICDCSSHIGCPYKGLVERQKCPDFRKNPDVGIFVKVDKDFEKMCNNARNTQTYKLEQIKDMCERQKQALDEIIKIVENIQNGIK